MEDDIDIEEHDLMDNPQIRSMFPDLAIKEERLSNLFEENSTDGKNMGTTEFRLEYEDSIPRISELTEKCDIGEQKSIPKSSELTDSATMMTMIECRTGEQDSIPESSELTSNANIEHDTGKFDSVMSMNMSTDLLTPTCNEIINGSKPNKNLDYETFEKQLMSYQPLVYLDDLGPYLHQSGRFCEDCFTLFPKFSEYNSHKTLVHCGKNLDDEINSETKKNKIQHREHNSKLNCKDCFKSFNSKRGLRINVSVSHKNNLELTKELGGLNDIIQDIRIPNDSENLEQQNYNPQSDDVNCGNSETKKIKIQQREHSSKFRCKDCFKSFDSKRGLRIHASVSHKKKFVLTKELGGLNIIIQRSEQQIFNPQSNVNVQTYYRCYICSYYFKEYTSYCRHIFHKHNVTEKPKDIKVPFDVKCKLCFSTFKNIRSYTVHIIQKHAKVYWSKNGNRPLKLNKYHKLYYSCYICSYYSAKPLTYDLHLLKNHSLTEVSDKYTRVAFNPICKYCSVVLETKESYNSHLLKAHRDYVYGNFHLLTTFNKPEINQTKTRTYYRCTICYYYFATHKTYCHHLIYNHGISESRENKEIFNKQCPFCSRVYLYYANFNSHIYNNHHDFYKSLPENPTETFEDKDILHYICSICGCVFKKVTCYDEHMKVNHKTTDNIISNTTPEYFNGQCKFCAYFHDGNGLFNIHIYRQHAEYYTMMYDDKEAKSEMYDLFYKCNVCGPYFYYMSIYISHMRINHNQDAKDVDLAKVSFVEECQFCHNRYENISNYNQHLDKCQPCTTEVNMQTINPERSVSCEVTTVANRKETNTNSECHRNSNNYDRPNNEISDKHNTKHAVNIDTYKTEIETSGNEKSKFVWLKDTKTKALLKSTIFKCVTCDIHFLSAELAVNHIKHLKTLINWKCPLCFLLFKVQDQKLHLKQHEDSLEINIKQVSPSDLHQILYSCPKCCPKHFTEKKFIDHRQACESDPPNCAHCRYCNILIDYIIAESHELGHSRKESCTFIFINGDEIMPIKHAKKLPLVTLTPKKRNLDAQYDLTYCHSCKCFLCDINRVPLIHKNAQCMHILKYICKMCGLVLTKDAYELHMTLHNNFKNLKLQDLNFYDMNTGERMCPPAPEFPKCSRCQVHFISKEECGDHSCTNEQYFICTVCDKKYMLISFVLHLSFHEYTLYHNNRISFLNDDVNVTNIDKDNSAKINKVKENSNILNQKILLVDVDLVEIVYNCLNCHTTMDSYDNVIEHCQNHITREETIKTNACAICHMKFDTDCYIKHQELHSKYGANLKYTVIKFDLLYFTSENNVWLKHIFGSLNPNQADSITSKSIYKFDLRIKLNIIQDGPPNLTLFKCDKCGAFIEGSAISGHADNSCFKSRMHACSFCGISFISAVAKAAHEETIHKNCQDDIVFESYRIVLFNREQDACYNKLLSCRKQHVLFKCRNCDVVIDNPHINDHDCNIEDIKKCENCGMLLSSDDYDVHTSRHRDLVTFRKSNIKVILFGHPDDAKSVKSRLVSTYNGTIYDYTFYNCQKCNVCIYPKHTHSCNSFKTICPVCNLNIANSDMKYHRKLHETDQDFIRENMTVVTFTPDDTHN